MMKREYAKSKLQQGFSLAVIPLIIIAVGVIGFAGWKIYSSNRSSDSSTSNGSGKEEVRIGSPATLLRECPDQWIENEMPSLSEDSSPPSEYFIIDGQRKETKDYDVDWIKANCSVKAQQVY